MTVIAERVEQTFAPVAETPPKTAEELEHVVLTKLFQAVDGSTDMHQLFYGDPGVSGITPSALNETQMPASGCTVLVKDETYHTYVDGGSEQHVRAFKRCGALLALAEAKLTSTVLNEVAAASSGNFAKGVTTAAVQLGIHATVFMTRQSELVKQDALRDMGATLNTSSATLQEALDKARNHTSDNTSATTLHPFEDVAVIAGQATSAFEVLDDLVIRHSRGDIDVHADQIVIGVPFGGGGYAAAVGIVFKWAKKVGLVRQQIRVIAVEPKNKPTNQLSDGTMTHDGDVTSLVVRDERYVQGVVTVHDEEIDEAAAWLHHATGKVVEPVGALATTLATTGIVRDNMILVSLMSGASVSNEKFAGRLERSLDDGFSERYPAAMDRINNTLASLAMHSASPQEHLYATDTATVFRRGTRVWSGR